jgi:hypothetical protein
LQPGQATTLPACSFSALMLSEQWGHWNSIERVS